MSNIIDSIQLSGTIYTLSAQTSGGGVPESTFSAYTAATDSRIAEDEEVTAAGLNALNDRLSEDEEVTAAALNTLNESLSGKQDTLISGTNIKTINNESLLGSGNIDIQGGSTYTAGRGISIANDTISFSLPISAGTGSNSIIEGSNTTASGFSSHAEGGSTKASGNYSHAEGLNTTASGNFSHAEGVNVTAKNVAEHASGRYNNSVSESTTFGNSGNTLFSVGNGTSDIARHNAFEIRQNGDIYLTKDGQDVKLQDQLGGSSITVDTSLDSGSTNPVENRVIYNKIDEVEEVTAAGLNALNDAVSGKADADSVYTKTETDNAITAATAAKQDTLISGTNIKTINNESLLGSGNIDIQGGGSSYTAGDGIDITNDVISVTGKADTSAVTAIQDSLSGYVTTDTEQIISGRKIFTYSASSSKAIEFKQTDDSAKVGFRVRTSAATNNELASFEFRPNTFTINGVQHPLLYFGHYRNNNTASGGIEQTVIGFRQYDQPHSAAYHYLLPLPERAKTPFNLTTSFKDYYAPMGYKVNTGGTIVTTDETGVVDLSSYIGGGGSTYTAGDGIDITSDVISVTGKVDTDDFNTYSGSVESRLAEDEEVTAAALNTLNDALGGMKLVKLTQTEYDNLSTKDSNTLYVIVN